MAQNGSMSVVGRELILGGQKSGKSRRAEMLARHWMAGSGGRRAVLLATATADDPEMSARIARHRVDRARNTPGLECVEVPLALPEAIRLHTAPDALVLVDCLTLWLTNALWPDSPVADPAPHKEMAAHALRLADELESAVGAAKGPLVLVGNEIGMGVIPLGPEVRGFVDALGLLNQAMARCCERVTWMVAGLPMRVKDV